MVPIALGDWLLLEKVPTRENKVGTILVASTATHMLHEFIIVAGILDTVDFSKDENSHVVILAKPGDHVMAMEVRGFTFDYEGKTIVAMSREFVVAVLPTK